MESLESNTDDKSSSQPEGQPQPSGAQDTSGTPSDITDLQKLEKFKFEGQEMTYKELQAAYMRQQDYTRKTQELSQDRNYYDNLNFDLAKVRSNPELATKFKEIYPEKFHSFLDTVLQKQSQEQAGKTPQVQTELDPKLVSRIDQIEKMVTEDKVTAIEAKLEAQDQRMSGKFPMADIEAVYARAQAAHAKGTKLTDEAWEKIWKDDHDKHVKRYEAHYKGQFEKQKDASSKAKDIGPGGGIPGQAPQRVALKDVADQVIRSQSG